MLEKVVANLMAILNAQKYGNKAQKIVSICWFKQVLDMHSKKKLLIAFEKK